MRAAAIAPTAGASPPPDPLGDPLPHVRATVRDLLLASPAYLELSPDKRRELATAMVRVCHAAASLVREETESRQSAQVSSPSATTLSTPESPASAPHPHPLSVAQNAGSDFSGVAAGRVAGTTQAILNAVSFPRFVTDLINGVFKAMLDSSAQQMNSYVELLNNVAASSDGFADSNMGPDRARQWLADKYPGSLEVQRDDADPNAAPGDPQPASTLRLRDGASMPSEHALRTDLGLEENDSVPSGDPERTLVPLARARLAKMRQEMLASMVMLGMQRIVVESGRISAAMRFHIDTRSAAQDDHGSTFSEQNTISAGASFGVGPWGANAAITNTIGYVSTDRSQTTEEMNTSVDLNSSVEINFKSDYLPLNRLAGPGQVDRIRANTRNPEAEADQAATQQRTARAAQNATSDQARRTALDTTLRPPAAQPAVPPAPRTAAPSPAAQPAASPAPTSGAPAPAPATAQPQQGAQNTTPAQGNQATR